MFSGSRALWLVARNIPLGHCRKPEYSADDIAQTGRGMGYNAGKNPDEIARVIVTALGHPGVPELIAEEWELLGPALRMRITDMCNTQRNSRSGNCSKGIFRLDKLTGGKILTRKVRETERVLIERDGQTGIGYRKVPLPAVLGASRKYASYPNPEK